MKQPLAEFQKAHSLPDLSVWVDLEETVSPGMVRTAFHEKLAAFADLLQQLVWPEGFGAVAEASVLTDAEREHAHVLYNRIMLIEKDCVLLEIASTPAEDIALIKRLCTEWPALVKEIKAYVVKTKGAYEGRTNAASVVSYLG